MLQYNQILLGGGALPISGFEVIQSGSQTQLVASVDGGSLLIEADLQAAGNTLTASNTQTSSASATLLPSALSGADHVFAVGTFGTSLRIADVTAGGVGTFQTVQGSGGMGITALELVVDGAAPTVLLAHDGGTQLGLFDISGSNTLSSAGTSTSLNALDGAAITDVALADLGGGVQIAIVASAEADTVVSVRLNADGSLTELDQAGVNTGVGIGAPSDVMIAEIDGKSFALVASTTTSSITVFELGADGRMTVRDQINDSAATRFASVQEAEMLMLDDRCFVALAGADGGVTVLQLLGDGSLHQVATYTNDGFDTFGEITSFEMFAVGNTLHILTHAEGSDNIHSFSLDTSLLGDVTYSSASGDTAKGTGAADLLIADTDNATLTGGAGEDTFVFGQGADSVLITDYQHGTDTIDLSHWGRIYNLNALTVTELSNGIRFAFDDDTLTIRTDNQQSLTLEDFTNSDLFGLWRIPSEEQDDDIAHDPNWDGTLSLQLGADSDDTLVGNASDEVIAGMEGADELSGFSGSDILAGGRGHDRLTGGADQDVFIFDLGDNNSGDVVLDYEAASFDVAAGTLSGDIIFTQNGGSVTPILSGDDVLIGGATLSGAGTGSVFVQSITADVALDVWGDGIAAAWGSGQISSLSSTLFDIGGTESYAQITFQFDGQGQVSSAQELGDNGTQALHSYDTQDTEDWQRSTERFDTADRLTKREVLYDDGTSVTTSFDAANNQAWEEIFERRDAQDRRTEYMLTYDTGISIRTLTDAENANTWDTILEYRDAGGALYDKRTNYDDGTQVRLIFDTDESETWGTVLEYRDAGGALYDKRTNYDDGTQLRLIFDTDESETWGTVLEYRDAGGALYDKRTNYDDGNQLRLVFDTDESETWDTILEYRDAGGALYDKRTNYDDGAELRLIFDTDDAANWDTILEYRDAGGALYDKRTNYDDGNQLWVIFDVDNTEAWDTYTRLLDSNGHILSESYDWG